MTQHLWHDWHDVRRKVAGGHATAYDTERERQLRQLLFGPTVYRLEQTVAQARDVAQRLQAQRRPNPPAGRQAQPRYMSEAQRQARDRILRNSRR